MSKATVSGIFTAIFLFVLPFVWSNSFLYPSENAKYFYVLLGVITLGIYVVYRLFHGSLFISLKGRWMLLLAGVSLLVWYIASLFGVYPEHSLFSDVLRNTGVLFITFVMGGVWFLSEVLTKDDWRLVRRSIIYSGVTFAFLSYFAGAGLGFDGSIGYIDFTKTGLTLGNETFVGSFLVLSIILTLAELWSSPNMRAKRFLLGALVAQAISPFLLGRGVWTMSFIDDPLSILGTARASSATMLIVFIFTCGLYILNRWIGKKAVRIYALLLLAGMVGALGLLFTPGSTVQENYIEASTAARIIVWEDAWQTFQERPLLGWGPENFRLAQEKTLDNRLYLKNNIGEVWFDRAHNIFLDALVSVGIVGLLVLVFFLSYIFRVLYRAYKNGHLHYGEMYMLGTFFIAHILQLQTSFNVAVTYVLLGVVVGYALWLEKEMSEFRPIAHTKSYVVGGVLGILLIGGIISPLYGEYARTRAVLQLFAGPGHEKQLELAEKATERLSNVEVLRFLSSSVITGLLQQVAITQDPQKQTQLLARGHEQLSFYKERYEVYFEEMPTDYRMRMNYAYLLLTKTVLGDVYLDEAKRVIEESYDLSPGNPLTPSMHAIAELYSGNLEVAQAKASEAVAINPDIEFTRKIADHIDVQVRNFPNIEVIKVNNL